MIRRKTTALVISVLAIVAVGTAGAGTNASIPRTTFVSIVGGVPTNIDTAVFQGRLSTENTPGWSSPLVRPVPIKPGSKTLPGAFAMRPYLATSWKREANGSYVFNLRRGVKSPAGHTFTSADVKYTFDRALAIDPIVRSLLAVAYIDPQNPITPLGPYQVRLNVTREGSLTLGVLHWYGFGMLDSKLMKENASDSDPWSRNWASTHSASFGAYSVKSFAPGQAIELAANPNFFGPKPFFRRVIVKGVPDAATRYQLVMSGQADFANQLEWGQFRSAADAKGRVQVFTPPDSQQDVLTLNHRFGPFADVRVREAISLAIDRAAIVRLVFRGFATPAGYQWSDVLGVSGKPAPYRADVNRARTLLQQAGQPNLSFAISYATGVVGPYAADLATLIQAQLARVGVRVTLDPIASPTEFETSRRSGKFQAYLFSQRPAVQDAVYSINNAQSSRGNLNTYGYSNSKLDGLIQAAIVTPPGKRYNRLTGSIAKTVQADVPLVPLVDKVSQFVFSPRIRGFEPIAYQSMFYEGLRRG